MKILFYLALILAITSCKEIANRKVVLTETPDGRPFHFMPIYEDGETGITITIAWPMHWAFDAGKNPAVPYAAAEAILSGGTESIAPQDVLEFFNDNDARGGFYINANHAVGELSFHKDHIEDIVSIASEMLTSPKIDPAWMGRIKQGLLTNQTQVYAQSAHQMWAAARVAVLGDSLLNDFLSLSKLDTIEAVQESDLRDWHKETIMQSGVTIAVAGTISHQDAGKAIDQLLSGLPDAEVKAAPVVEPNFSARTILLHLPNAEKSTLGFVGQLPPTIKVDDLTDHLALNFFARPGNGPLFDAARTKLGASYGMEAGVTNYDRATRILFIGGEVETTKLAKASELILRTYEDFRTNPDLTGLSDLRREMADVITQRMTYANVAARTMLELALMGRDPSDAPRLGELLENTQARDIQERLVSVFPPSGHLIVVAVSPDANALPGACVVTEINQVAQCP